MKKGKRGFTLIEVALFLVITGALFIGVTVGVQNSIYQQRVNDSVQGFTEFLRGVYSEVLNVQNSQGAGGGRSDQAIYGKLITFGETHNLAGEWVNTSHAAGNEIFVYTVVGKVLKQSDNATGNILNILDGLDANVATVGTSNNGRQQLDLAGLVESYIPRWAAQIEPPCGSGNCNNSYQQLEGMVLIARHPSSGTVYTYYTGDLVQINQLVEEYNTNAQFSGGNVQEIALDFPHMGFSIRDIDFCINPEPGSIRLRHDVRIGSGARNASSVEIISDDESRCRET